MTEKFHTPSHGDDVTRVESLDNNSTAHSMLFDSGQDDTRPVIPTSYADTGSSIDSQLEVGSVLKDTYELVAVLGEGGMGTVFKALNKVWQEVEARNPYVAIKVLKPELSANKQLVKSLYSDFDRSKMLANCPNIINVHGFDRDGPHVYMTMEYLSGQTLGDYFKRTRITLAQIWLIIESIGNALAYAHKHNIVHRDIKPANIMITDDGIVKVLDFGIASKINEIEGDETKFSGHELGALTTAYASPEMFRDYPPDTRDDIYAFACVIYEILTGNQFYKQKINKAAPIHGLNGRQMDALNKALAPEREQRTASIQELLDKLRPVKMPWVKYLSLGGGVVVITVLVLWGASYNPPESPVIIEPQHPSPITIDSPHQQSIVINPPYQPPIVIDPPPQPPIVIDSPRQPPIINNRATSSDGLIQLQTSKSEYKSGSSFHLNFTLTQPMYVRIIDRDADGQVTMLRPNSRQPDKLLPANKEHIFPPKGINIPVEGTGGSTVTLIASTQPFPKIKKWFNDDGSVSAQVQSGLYSWAQVHYALIQ